VDFRLYGRVLWRFKIIVVAGFVLAVVLALLSVVRVSSHGLSYRDSQLWSAKMRLQVTQSGFPEGRLYAERSVGSTNGTPEPVSPGEPVVDPARFATLAIYYAELITSDPVRQLANRGDGVRAEITATPLRNEQSGVLLPFIDVLAVGKSKRGTILYADRTARALNLYISDRQRTNNVKPSDRAIVQTIEHPHGASVFRARPKTMPIVVFLAVMFATIGLAFILENARPRLRELDPRVRDAEHETERRRTA
jgi:hypothetical protein